MQKSLKKACEEIDRQEQAGILDHATAAAMKKDISAKADALEEKNAQDFVKNLFRKEGKNV